MEVNPIAVPEEAYPYLVAQRGAISDMREDRQTWLDMYGKQLVEEFARMQPYLPADCKTILDVGSGCGGIDILLSRHYGHEVDITLLDGIDDPPVVTKHARTFSHFAVAERFLKVNGCSKVRGIDARRAPGVAPRYWDLVISQKSWCFHYPPWTYLGIVESGCTSDTVLIIDIRSDKEWKRGMSKQFNHVATAHSDLKYSTEVFRGITR